MKHAREPVRRWPGRRRVAVALGAVAVALVLLGVVGRAWIAMGSDGRPRAIAQLAEDTVATIEVAGMRLSVLGDDGFEANLRTGEGADEPVQVYSVTKMFVASLAFLLAERGVVDLDAPIGPLEVLAEPDAFRDVSLLDLFEHRVRLTDYRDVLADDEVLTDVELIDRVVASSVPERADDQLYTTTGYMVAGVVLSERAGTSWSQLLVDEILDPLELSDTTVGDAATSGSRHGAGAVFSTTSDLARFAVALFAEGRVVSGPSLERMLPTSGHTLGAGLWAMCPCALDGTSPTSLGHPGETTVVAWIGAVGAAVAVDLDESVWLPEGRFGHIDDLVAGIGAILADR